VRDAQGAEGRFVIKAAEYDEAKCATVANLEMLSPSVLYKLAEGEYSEQEEAAILKETNDDLRIDVARANEICRALTPPPEPETEPESEPAEEPEEGTSDDDPDSILDGPPPELPPAEPATPVDFLVPSFDQAVAKLKELSTKPSEKFLGTIHSASEIDAVIEFLMHVAHLKRKKAAA
jgi:hypothetical protein